MFKQLIIAIFLALFLGAVTAELSLGPMVTNPDLPVPLIQQEEQQWYAKKVVFVWSAGTIFMLVLLLGRVRLSAHFQYAAWGACLGAAVAVIAAYILAAWRGEMGHKSAGTAFDLARHFLLPMLAVLGWAVGAMIAVMHDRSSQSRASSAESPKKG